MATEPEQVQQPGVPESPTPPTQDRVSAQTGTSAETDSPSPVVALSAAERTELDRLEKMMRRPAGPYPNPDELKLLIRLRKRNQE